MPTDGLKLETVLRLRSAGRIAAEYTMRESGVEIVNYFPSGEIQDHGWMSLPDFLAAVTRMRDERFPACPAPSTPAPETEQ